MTLVTLGGRKMSLMCDRLMTLRPCSSSTSCSGMAWVGALSVTSAILRPHLHAVLTGFTFARAQHEHAQTQSSTPENSAHPRSAAFQSNSHLLNSCVVIHAVLLLA